MSGFNNPLLLSHEHLQSCIAVHFHNLKLVEQKMIMIQIHILRMRDGAWKTAEGFEENFVFASGI